jgi:hypothetical protein
METQKPALKFSKKWYNFGIYTIITYIVCLIALSILLSSPLPFAGIVIPVLFALYIMYTSDRWVDSLKNQQFPENLDVRQKDHSMGSFSAGSYFGLDIMIQFYVRNRFPFKIYHCYNPQEFLDVLRNDKTKYAWIIGHGWRGGITFKWTKLFREPFSRKPKKTYFSYAKIRDDLSQFPRKSFIAQFHCNHIEKTFAHNESLVEILLDTFEDSNYYITEGLTHVISIWFATRDLVSKVQRTSLSESEITGDPDISGSCRC